MTRDYLSFSALRAFSKSPNHYLEYERKKAEGGDPSPAMHFGRLAHSLVLEPEKFGKDWAVAPQCDRRTKAGKATWADFLESATGREVASFDDFKRAKAVAESVSAHPESERLFSGSKFEKKLNGKIGGFEFLGFADISGADFIVDLKTTRDASHHAFQRDAFNGLYHIQAAIYLKLTGLENYYIIAAESVAPYNVGIFEMDSEMIARGFELLEDLIFNFATWDGKPSTYSSEIEVLKLPGWAL